MASRMSNRRSRRPRRGRRGDQGQAKTIAALVAIPLVSVSVGGAGLAYYMGIEQPDGYCYARSEQHRVAVLLDSSFTQESSPTQYRDYLTGFLRAYDQAPANAEISLITTASNRRGSILTRASTLSMCKPAATPAEQEAIGAPSYNGSYLRKQAEKARKDYVAMVEGLLADARNEARVAGDSPILEQLQAVSRYDGFQGADRSLTVITDGVQNSEIAQFCVVQGDMPSFEKFETQNRYEYVRPNQFTGVDVTFLLVERGKLPAPGIEHCSNEEIYAWWPSYFRANGAKRVELTRLRHWADES